MTSILFPETLPSGLVNPFPPKISAISYNYSGDGLILRAHMKDKFRRLQQDGEYAANFLMCPMIFQQTLSITDPETRFQVREDSMIFPETRVYLQGTKLVDGDIFTTVRQNMSNVCDRTFLVCWGGNFNVKSIKTMKGFIDLFFNSYFNGDYTLPKALRTSEGNCIEIRGEIAEDSFEATNYKLISKDANAIYTIHRHDNPSIFFWLKSAGFNPIVENSDIMLVPLKSVILTDNGIDYPGFVTPIDLCHKKWFILPDGKFVGQMSSSQTARNPT